MDTYDNEPRRILKYILNIYKIGFFCTRRSKVEQKTVQLFFAIFQLSGPVREGRGPVRQGRSRAACAPSGAPRTLSWSPTTQPSMLRKKEERIAVSRSLWHGGTTLLFNIIMDQKAILIARVPPEFNSVGSLEFRPRTCANSFLKSLTRAKSFLNS